jgi:anaerobic dimethyl sulfoxide reductase subunit B (iron-sulfur subunit)
MCLEACPYEAPQFGAEQNAKVQMCNLCIERWSEGKKPICVAGCPTRALDAGPIGEIEAKYGKTHKAVGFTYDGKLRPSVLFKPRPEVSVLRR